MTEQLELVDTGLTFEQAMKQLEDTVKTLEAGNISLDDSLLFFEKGIKLINFCQQKITLAEQKVSLLIKNNEGIVLEPFLKEANEE